MTYDLTKAIQIAQKGHEGQRSMYDDRKSFYDEHPFKVMRMVRKSAPYHHKIRYEMVAILHDVIEDTKWTIEALRELGIPEDILTAVDLLTHKEGVTYSDYIFPIKENELARRVKIADMLSNMTFFYMYNREYKMNKYINGLVYLMNGR